MINLHQHTVQIFLKRCWRTMTREAPISLRNNSTGEKHPTAGIIVIGDEILKAQVKDSNCFYACKMLYKHGVKVQKVSIVPDNIMDIANEIKEFSQTFNYVFTSGGIGPTHDDVTYEAVALAFNDTLHYHPILVDIIKTYFGSDTSSAYKMAYIPTKSMLRFGKDELTGRQHKYPCIVMQNVYIFPGSPTFFETSFCALCKESLMGYKSFAATEVYVNAREESFAKILSAVAQECPNVSFGSYPERNRYYKARVTIESENKKDTETAKKMFCDRVPHNVLIHYDRTPHADCLPKYKTLIERSQHRLIYENSFKKFVNYYQKPEEVCIYLDGSEESVAMVHLARVADNKLRKGSKSKLYAVCLKSDTSKSGMTQFFHQLCERYDIELNTLEDEKIDAVEAIKDFILSRPQFRVLLLGKRMKENEKQIYDNIARLNNSSLQIHFPLIDWESEDVAHFFRSLSLHYYMPDS